MPPTPLTKSRRYIHPETALVYWLDAVADVNALTRPEIDAGIDLTAEIADAPGWGVSSTRVEAMDLGSKFTSKIPGRINPDDAQLVFYSSKDTVDIRSLLGRGDEGFIVICHGGDVEGQAADVYPVEVTALSKPLSVSGDPAQITVDFSTTSPPGEDIPLPALGG